jgi:hypothetical protein
VTRAAEALRLNSVNCVSGKAAAHDEAERHRTALREW